MGSVIQYVGGSSCSGRRLQRFRWADHGVKVDFIPRCKLEMSRQRGRWGVVLGSRNKIGGL